MRATILFSGFKETDRIGGVDISVPQKQVQIFRGLFRKKVFRKKYI